MAAQGRNEGFHVLDDFVCEAIHAPSVSLAKPTNQGQNEGMSVVEELVVDVGTQAEASDEDDRHRQQQSKEGEFVAALAAFRAGKQESLPVLLQVAYDFLTTRRGIWREARKLGQLEEDDVIADVVASLPAKIERFAANDLSSFYRWLAVVAKYRVIDLVRREVRHKHELLEDSPDPHASLPSEPLVAQEAVDRLLVALADLPEDYRTIFTLRLSGMSLSEISELLGTSQATTAMRFHRMLGKLRDRFVADERE